MQTGAEAGRLPSDGYCGFWQATSSLDTLTERRIQEALHGLKADRTSFIVAHRLSTIMDSELIVVMHVRLSAQLLQKS